MHPEEMDLDRLSESVCVEKLVVVWQRAYGCYVIIGLYLLLPVY